MKELYRIHPILTSKIRIDKGVFTYLRNFGEKLLVPTLAWLIDGGKEPILVDPGCSLQEFMQFSVLSSGGEEGVPIEESLEKYGISPSDIKTIVMTHLHSDHVLNAKKFPNAKVIVQEEELEFARNPHPLFSAIFRDEWYEGLDFKTIQGDTEVIPGVKAVFTPGHTPGGQSVSVTTEKGEAVIVGLCTLDDNFTDKGDMIPTPHTNPLEAYDSITRIRKIADFIIPLHSERAVTAEYLP